MYIHTPHIYIQSPEMLDLAKRFPGSSRTRKELSVAEAAVKDALRIFRERGTTAAAKWGCDGP